MNVRFDHLRFNHVANERVCLAVWMGVQMKNKLEEHISFDFVRK